MGEPTIEEIREAREQIPETDGVDSEAMVIFANMYTPDAFPVCQVTDESFLKFYHQAPDYIDFLLAEVDRLKAENERDETCIVCSALLLTDNSEPPHCIDCHVTDEHRERWEDQLACS